MNTASLKRAGLIVGGLVAALLAGEIIAAIGTRGRHLHGLPVPIPVLLQSLETGCTYVLLAVGLVLIYRATRIINFAQVGFGIVGAAVFFELVTFEHWPYLAGLVVALLVGPAAGFLIELLVIRRFAKSSRLMLTVVTLGLAELLTGAAGSVPFALHDFRPHSSVPRTPLSQLSWKLFPTVLTGNDVLLMVATAAILAGFALFFRFTSIGIAIRGAAENDDRASLLGIDTSLLSSVVWMIAATLATVSAVLLVPIQGGSSGAAAAGGIGSSLLLRGLAAAALGGMDSLPVAVAGALGIAVLERSVFVGYQESAIFDGVLLALIVIVLLLQRKKLGRALDAAAATSWEGGEEIRPIPAELAGLETVRSARSWVLGIGTVVLLGLPWVLSLSQVNQASLFVIYGMVVVSLVVLTGWGGQISLGQFGFVAVGAAVSGSLLTRAHWPVLPVLLVGSLSGAVAAVIIGLPALRIRGLFLAVTTLAFSIATATVLLNQRYLGSVLPVGVIKRPTLLWLRLEDERAFYYVCLVGLALAVFAAAGVRHSRVGRVLIAMRENERSAQAFGINLVRTRLTTFALAGFLAAFAGSLFALHQHGVNQQSFSPDQSIQIFIMAIIGGLGSIGGALTGALYLGTLNLLTGNPIVRLLASSVGLLVVLLFFPGGLGAAVFGVRDAFLRRVAIRRRIFVPSLMGALGSSSAILAKIQLAPKTTPDGKTAAVPHRYRQPSRIGATGSSQQGKRWSY